MSDVPQRLRLGLRRAWANVPPGTRVLLYLNLGLSLLVAVLNGAWFYFQTPAVAAIHPWLVLSPETLGGGRLTALASNGLISAPTGILGLLILLGIIGYFAQDQVRGWWRTHRAWLVGVPLAALALVAVLDRYVLVGVATGLVSDWIVLSWIAPVAERRWGQRRLWRFAAIVMLTANLVGGLLLWLWPSTYGALLGTGVSQVVGTRPLFVSLVAVWALSVGRQPLGGSPIRGHHVLWLLIAIGVFDLLLEGVAAGAMLLSALAATWLLVTGTWRPQYAYDRLRLALIDRRLARRKRKLVVHPGGRAH